MPNALSRLARSPSWWIALATLVLNDHVLKHAFGGAFTGKLSDFAGLFVAAPLLAACLQALGGRSKHGALGAYVATGGVFAAINLSREAASVLENLLAWRVWTDPTDLVALPTLAVAWWRFERTEAPQTVARVGWHERLAIALGGLACIATSPAPFPITLAPPSPGEVQVTGLYADTYEDESTRRENIRVRTLLPSVELDCARLAENPRRAVTRRLFEPAELWSLGHREMISRTNTRECEVLWLEHDEAGVVLVTWTGTDPVRIALERNGDAIGWVEEIGVGHLSRGVPRAPIPGRECVGLEAPPTLSQAWPNDSPTGLYELAVASSPDGCTELTFTPVLDTPVEPFDPSDPTEEPPVEEPPVEEPPVEEPPVEEPPVEEPPADEPMDPMDGPPLPPEDEPVPPVEPTVTRLFACGYPTEAFAVFDGPVRLDTTAGGVRWVQEAVDGTLRASLTIDESTALALPALDVRPFDGCETSNACGEIATPWEVTLADDFGWVQLGPRAFGTADGTTRVDVMLAQSSVAVDFACTDGVGSLGGRFVVARSERFEAADPEPMPDEPTPDEPMPDLPPETP